MSNIRYFESQLDRAWSVMSRDYAGFDKPFIVPGRAIAKDAPMYMKRYIDAEPNSFYLFLKGDPLRHQDISRAKACEFVERFFYEQMGMPSSYDIEAGGDLPRSAAISKEVLPAENDRSFNDYYEEQMAAVSAQMAAEERQRRIERLGFDPDDPNEDIIDVPVDGETPNTTAVAKATTTAVGMPKPVFFAVCFHISAGGNQLGHSGAGRLGRRPSGYLRENEFDDAYKAAKELLQEWHPDSTEEQIESALNRAYGDHNSVVNAFENGSGDVAGIWANVASDCLVHDLEAMEAMVDEALSENKPPYPNSCSDVAGLSKFVKDNIQSLQTNNIKVAGSTDNRKDKKPVVQFKLDLTKINVTGTALELTQLESQRYMSPFSNDLMQLTTLKDFVVALENVGVKKMSDIKSISLIDLGGARYEFDYATILEQAHKVYVLTFVFKPVNNSMSKPDNTNRFFDECDACGDDDCQDGEKCGLKESDDQFKFYVFKDYEGGIEQENGYYVDAYDTLEDAVNAIRDDIEYVFGDDPVAVRTAINSILRFVPNNKECEVYSNTLENGGGDDDWLREKFGIIYTNRDISTNTVNEGKKCGLKESDENAVDADLQDEINEIVGEDDKSETEVEIDEYAKIVDDADEPEDMLSESVIMASNRLSKEIW